jgi:dienelactone hydrolase
VTAGAAAADVVELQRDGRPLPTTLHVPAVEPPWPLVVFAHGWMGHPRKFTRLFGHWVDAGYAVAAPTFPFTNEASSGREFDDVAAQPADVRFVLAHLLADPRFDGRRVAAAGFSLGAVTAVAAAFERSKEVEVAAVIAISGRVLSFCECDVRGRPLLDVHGRLDDVVPYADGVALYDRAAPPKALLTIELPGHQHYVENEPPSPGDAVVDAVTMAFLDRVLHASDAPAPAVDPSVGSLDSEGVW